MLQFLRASLLLTRSQPLLGQTVGKAMSTTTTSAGGSERLKGKAAIVTASSDGIGFAIARNLAKHGSSVIISSRKEKNVQKAVGQLKNEGLDVEGLVAHVGKAEDRQRLVEFTLEKKGRIDFLVSNAAVNPYFGSTLETPEDAWDKIFEINVKAAFLLSQAVAPHMEKVGGGSIVYISSIGGFMPFPAIGAYSISKTALLGLTKTIAGELATTGIRVNCVCPGVIKTKFSQALTEDPAVLEESLRMIPMKRLGLPEDIGGIVSFLCSDEASYITGENFVVAGGAHSRL